VRAAAVTDARPAVASRAAVVHALLVLARAAGGGSGAVTLGADPDGARVRVWAAAAGDDAGPAPVGPDALAACAWLLGGGAVDEGAGVAAVRLPALGG
jgi:hypothetical protein